MKVDPPAGEAPIGGHRLSGAVFPEAWNLMPEARIAKARCSRNLLSRLEKPPTETSSYHRVGLDLEGFAGAFTFLGERMRSTTIRIEP